MCGIHFAINAANRKDIGVSRFMRDAFITNQVRGTDGAGIFIVPQKVKDKPLSATVHKSILNGQQFISNTLGSKIVDDMETSLVAVGHVRAATEGAISTENAHPFRIQREDGSYLVGVHNGTLNAWKRHKNAKDFKVDSHWALAEIAKNPTQAFAAFDGAFAFIWWDSNEPETLYMARNDKRPLCFVYDSTHKIMLGASEPGMLGWLFERNRFHFSSNKDYDHLFSLETGQLYAIDLNDPTKRPKKPLPKFDWRTLPYNYSSANNDDGNYGMYPHTSRWRNGRWEGDYEGYDERRQNTILNGIKEALRKARTNAEGKGPTTDSASDDDVIMTPEELQKRLDDQIIEESNKDKLPVPVSLFPRIATFVHKPNDQAATRNEIKEARASGIYGRVVQWRPVHYEAGEQVLLGDFKMEVGGVEVPFNAELRYDITEPRAKNLIATGAPLLMAVVGVDRPGTDLMTYVVCNLDADQRKAALAGVRRNVN